MREQGSGMTEQPNISQSQSWNGDSGRAWVTMHSVLDQMLGPVARLIADTVAAQSDTGAAILDIGCGTGGTLLELARRLGPGHRYTGVDISTPMIDAARARASQRGESITFVVGDAQTFALVPDTFDHVVSRFGVMFFDDPVAAFTNLRMAAKPRGHLTFVCWRHPDENPFMTTAELTVAHLLPELSFGTPGVPGPFAFASAADSESILTRSGWSAIQIEPVDLSCRLAVPHLLPYLTQIGPVARALRTADTRTRQQVIGVLEHAYADFIISGQVHFTAACWLVTARR